jgi:hypothetical protein
MAKCLTSIAYADTGFLISLYDRAANSASAISPLAPRPVLLLTPLSEVEFSNAVELIVFRKEWTSSQARAIRETFRHTKARAYSGWRLLFRKYGTELSRRFSTTLGTRSATFCTERRPWCLSRTRSSHSTNASASSRRAASIASSLTRRPGAKELGETKTKILFAFCSPYCYIAPRCFQQVLHVFPIDLRDLLPRAC